MSTDGSLNGVYRSKLPTFMRQNKKNSLLLLLVLCRSKLASLKMDKITSAAGRLTLLQAVIYAMPIFQIMAIRPPVWLTKKINKAARAFLWANKETATGSQCLINWRRVCTPKTYGPMGGLGLPNLAARSTALRCRWLWKSWMDTDKPWVGLPLPIDNQVRALFEASVTLQIGDGASTQFWKPDKFSRAYSDLYKLCTLRKIMVKAAMTSDKWMRHFKADFPTEALVQFTRLWTSLLQVQLNEGIPDKLIWKWTANGSYSASSAYAAQFIGTIRPAFPRFIWRSDAPLKHKFYAWLAVHGRCLTADNLAKRGIPHDPTCPLCSNGQETAAHILAACPYAQEVWTLVADRAGLPATIIPTGATTCLSEWMEETHQGLNTEVRKLWLSITPLVWWTLWKERNERSSTSSTVHPQRCS